MPPPDLAARARPSSQGAALGIVILCVAFVAGALVRFPARGDATEEEVFATEAAREARHRAAAAPTVGGSAGRAVGEPAPSLAFAGEVAALRVCQGFFGDAPGGILTFQALLSSLAVVNVAVAAGLAGGPFAGGAAACLAALDSSQILATRAWSPVPLLTFLGSASLAVLVFGLTSEVRRKAAFAVAGLLAGLAACVHPLALVLAAGLAAAALAILSISALVSGALGFVLGTTPLLVHNHLVNGSPLPFAPRGTAQEGPLGPWLADWVGWEAATHATFLDRTRFLGDGAALGLLVVTSLGVLGLLAIVRGNGARAILGCAVGTLGALVAVAAWSQGSPALPACTASPAFAFLLTASGGLGTSVLAGALPARPFVTVAAGLAPALVGAGGVLAAVKTPPGLFAPRNAPLTTARTASDATAAPESPAASVREAAADSPKASPPPPESRATPPPPESRWRTATLTDLERARKVIAGEGGMTRPSVSLSNDRLLLTLRLENKNLDRGAAEPDAVRLCLRILEDNPRLDGLKVRIEGADGKVLSTATVPGDRARPFIPKLDDAYESRRLREWWPRMKG